MTRERYLKMCEQLGKEPNPEEIPPDWEDFPEIVIHAINTFSMLNPILLNNKIREGIQPNTTYITRRIYYEYELVFKNNKINKCVRISKEQIKLNWEKYNNYYKL